MADISTLALPLELARIASSNVLKTDNKSENKSREELQSEKKKTIGGAFAENILIEAGLSVVPFALISSLEYFDKNDEKNPIILKISKN